MKENYVMSIDANLLRKINPIRSSLMMAMGFMAGLSVASADQTVQADASPDAEQAAVQPLPAQSGQKSALFYGNTNHKKLASIVNVRVIDPAAPSTMLVKSDDIMATAIGRPQSSTALVGYNPEDNSYKDLYLNTIYYLRDGNPKRVSMRIGHDPATHTDFVPEESAHSNETGLSSPSYIEIDYLGKMRILTATKADGKKVLICPWSSAGETSIPFDNKVFHAVYYTKYGQMTYGAVVYDKVTYKFQKLTPPKSACEACGIEGEEAKYEDFTGLTLTASSKYKFLGDIPGTATSALVADDKLYILDKATLSIKEKPVKSVGTDVALKDLASASSKFLGDSVAYLYKKSSSEPNSKTNPVNLYKVDFATGKLTQLTKDHGKATANSFPTKFHSATDRWIIYGSDGLMMAVRKTANKASPTMLFENTTTSGIRYPFNFGIGNHYLYVTYSLDPETAKTIYRACVFTNGGLSTCRKNSFWSNVVPARQGKLNFTSDYPYTPYAYVRVDATDNFGGGRLTTVDPTKPLANGFAMGKVPTYNFNTFMHSSYYNQTGVDTDGNIVIYGKRDDNFTMNAFLVNLRKANSVVNLTNESAPSAADINGGDLHCHGRYCAVCHNFAGGKIYNDKAGTREADGYNLSFEFEDGSSKACRLGKGKGQGENFSMLYDDIKGKAFTPVITTVDGKTEIKRGAPYGHEGLKYTNCDWCHARPGDKLRYGAPAVINIEP